MPHPKLQVEIPMSYGTAKVLNKNAGERGQNLVSILDGDDYPEETAAQLKWELEDAIEEAENGDDEDELVPA